MSKQRGIVAAVLAAGCSKRFGTPKQLLMLNSKSMLQKVIDETCKTDAEQIFVVLGCNWRKIRSQVDLRRGRLLVNLNYREGVSSSIKLAVKRSRSYSGCLIILGDQPLVTSELINRLISLFLERKDAVAALTQYGRTLGTPAIIGRELFELVSKLEGDEGAKSLLTKYMHRTVIMQAEPELLFDVDTPEDYRLLIRKLKGKK